MIASTTTIPNISFWSENIEIIIIFGITFQIMLYLY